MTTRPMLLLAVAACSSPAERSLHQSVASTATFFHNGFGAGPAVFTDASGAVVEEHRYEPYGVPIDGATIDLNGMNKRTEPTTGWSDHGARWLAPETARWLSTDPPVEAPSARFMAAPWALHPYQYVDSNPIAYWDPDGRQPAPIVLQGPSCPVGDDLQATEATADALYGRSPVTAKGTPNAGYAYVTVNSSPGVGFGIGLVNAPAGPGATVSALRLDVGAGKWTDPATGTSNYGIDGQVDVARFVVTQGPVGVDGGAFNGDFGAYGNDSDASFGAQMNLIDNAVTIGNQHHSVRFGFSLGDGSALRAHYGDSDGNGRREWGLGFDWGALEFDFKTELPGQAYDFAADQVGGLLRRIGL